MELVYAALLLHKAGKEINETNVKKVAEAAGIKADDQQIKALTIALEGVDIEKEIKEAAIMPAAPAVGGEDKKTEVDEKKKEEEDKKAEESASEGLASLFG